MGSFGTSESFQWVISHEAYLSLNKVIPKVETKLVLLFFFFFFFFLITAAPGQDRSASPLLAVFL